MTVLRILGWTIWVLLIAVFVAILLGAAAFGLLLCIHGEWIGGLLLAMVIMAVAAWGLTCRREILKPVLKSNEGNDESQTK